MKKKFQNPKKIRMFLWLLLTRERASAFTLEDASCERSCYCQLCAHLCKAKSHLSSFHWLSVSKLFNPVQPQVNLNNI
jgi:hypothetical protein